MLLSRIVNFIKAAQQLGLRSVLLYAGYQARLRSGWLRWATPSGGRKDAGGGELQLAMKPANKKDLQRLLGKRAKDIYAEAEEILHDRVRLFGTAPRRLDIDFPGRLRHWTHYHGRLPGGVDIKPLWEAGRFGWATVLARAYWLSGDERYAEGFWTRIDKFITANPPNLGPHWSSAQEVGLRLIAWAFCYSLLAESPSSTATRKAKLAYSIAQHAERIPPTLDYARSQNNNHLLSEGLGLCTAAALLPQHRMAPNWKALGWAAFIGGIENQVHANGAYAQHSSNYHRLMLQLGTWAQVLADCFGQPLPRKTILKLSKATDWMHSLLEVQSGALPNLGPNDGAYALPLSVLPFADHRPALQAAGLSLKNERVLSSGIWDEMALWLGLEPLKRRVRAGKNAARLRLEGNDSWAYFRTAQFKERPGHADQLHVDLWWQGLNLAQDAGSFVYTAPAPWDNALASTKVHNTLTFYGRDQMTRASRFLWLDFAQAKVLTTRADKRGRLTFAAAQHNGYEQMGFFHRREITANARGWVIVDLVEPKDKRQHVDARLHWLLPDWEWRLTGAELQIRSPKGWVKLEISSNKHGEMRLSIFRAGKLMHGQAKADPVLGWVSPTYGVKAPALSLNVDVRDLAPFNLTSTWTLPK
ncbi:MAG: alginate lyase family protein [Anaerolineales bacterium]